METLPFEILSKIVSHLIDKRETGWETKTYSPYPPLAKYSTVSRQWQCAVEAIVFRRLSLNCERLVQAEGYLTPARLSHIRCVLFDFTFPHFTGPTPTVSEGQSILNEFNTSLGQLFNLLGHLPPSENPSVTLKCSTSGRLRDSYSEDFFMGTKSGCWYLELPSEWARHAPELPNISTFETTWWPSNFPLAPSSLNAIASKMTRLRKIDWWLTDGYQRNTASIHQRKMFAETMQQLPRSLKVFKFGYARPPARITTVLPSSLIPANSSVDPLSQALHQFTQRDGLERCEVDASVDSTLLWSQSAASNTKPHWPTLKHLHIKLDEILPSGQCIDVLIDEGRPYFGPSPLSYHSEHKKSTYDQNVLNQLAMAAARSARHMPQLDRLEIGCNGSVEMNITFKTTTPQKPCLELMGKPLLPQPSDETVDAWNKTAKVHGLKWDMGIIF